MMTWSAFLTDEVAERLVRVRSMAVGLSAALHAALVLAVFVDVSRPSAATGDAGVDVTFETTPAIERAVAATSDALPPPSLAPSEPAPTAPVEEPEPTEPRLAMAPAQSAAEAPREQPEPPPAMASAPPPESQPEETSVPVPPPAQVRLEEMVPGAESSPAVSARDFARTTSVPTTAPPPKAQATVVPPATGKRVAPEARPVALRSDQAQLRFEEDYFRQIVRRISQYRFYSNSQERAQQGLVVTRMTIARDGRLLDVALLKSSGFPTLDQAVVETIRRASPFAPLPAELGRDQQTFVVPVNYTRER